VGDADDVLVAHTMNGHPLRLIVPGWYGMAHVKWLRAITVSATPFTGFQQAVAYRLRQEAHEPGEAVTRIAPRALLLPPGFPDFMSRARIVRPGPVALEGRAWSGRAPVTTVEVSTDEGATWHRADLEPPPADGSGRWAWRRWRYAWPAGPGRHLLGARATDAHGNRQPLRAPWNRGGFVNNQVHWLPVHCVPEEAEPPSSR
jgi:DMSO/TMAO reductase YedYZ molybdopterin-dependent catalytic subunit